MERVRPAFQGRATLRHGFGGVIEAPSGVTPSTTWGSTKLRLPDGVHPSGVRLQAEDGAHSAGVLYSRGSERTVVVFNHPRADFSFHYLIPSVLGAGYAAFGGLGRYLGNDTDCIHECLLADLAAQVGFLREAGFEQVVLCGNSGGGSLSAFYQAQATTDPPGRLTTTPAGDPYGLNELDLPSADGLILVAAHIGEGAFLLENLDPSVTDEHDPMSCDPTLDMYNPSNGYRRPPDVSTYSEEFVRRYRKAQIDRCARLDAMARQDVARRRRYRDQMVDPDFEHLSLDDQLQITRMATASNYLTVARTAANPTYTDLSMEPSRRIIATLLGPDPHTTNYKLGGFASVMTPEGWLSTWSGLSSRANLLDNIERIKEPTLVIGFDADAGILPKDAEQVYARSAAPDKVLRSVDADHYGLAKEEPRERTIIETGAIIAEWMGDRFAGLPG